MVAGAGELGATSADVVDLSRSAAMCMTACAALRALVALVAAGAGERLLHVVAR